MVRQNQQSAGVKPMGHAFNFITEFTLVSLLRSVKRHGRVIQTPTVSGYIFEFTSTKVKNVTSQ